MRTLRRKGGFTLIELPVVIAVIAILAALLFPVFARTRERARQISCLSNVKQIGAAVLMYAQDYDERYPGGKNVFALWVPGPEGDWENLPTECCGNAVNISVAVKLLPYVKAPQLFYCPSDPDGDRIWGGGRDRRLARWPYWWHQGLSLGYTWPLFPVGKLSKSETPLSLAEISRPALLPMIGCFNEYHTGHTWAAWFQIRSGEVSYNVCYADGHAKFTRWWGREGDTPREQWPVAWNWWNPRQPVSVERPCQPTCAEEAARN